MTKEYTIKEYAELKGFTLSRKTRHKLGKNCYKAELSGRYKIEKKWKHEDDMYQRGYWNRKKKKFWVNPRQPGVRVWPEKLLKEVFGL